MLFLTFAMLSGCGWFRAKSPPPETPEIIVTGAPAESTVFIDDVLHGEASAANDKSLVVNVVPGTHKVELRISDRVVYRETVFVNNGDRRVVTVLSGSNRE